jgi:pimeloyl-ACP methyl ester carboxylesterase
MLDGVERRRLVLPDRDVEIALLDWGGDGPLALLHHANGFCAALWDPVAERLRERFHVVAMDARGHGDSSKPEGRAAYDWSHFGRDAAAVAAALAKEEPQGRVALGLGHSFGGTSLVLAAIERPGLFDRLVLVDPIVMASAVTEDPGIRAGRTNAMAEGARRRRQVWPDRGTARAVWAGKQMFAGWQDRVLDLYVAEGLADLPDGRVALKCPGAVEAAIFENNTSVDVMGAAPQLATPTLVLWAMHGNFPREHFEQLSGRMQHARLRDADAGHLVPMQRPDLVADEVLAFAAP